MKITSISSTLLQVPYRTPYRISPGETKYLKRVLVQVDTDEGITGFGETGVTIPERGGETIESIYLTIDRYFSPLIKGMDPFRISEIINKLESSHWGGSGFLCSKCAIDNALYDIMG